MARGRDVIEDELKGVVATRQMLASCSGDLDRCIVRNYGENPVQGDPIERQDTVLGLNDLIGRMPTFGYFQDEGEVPCFSVKLAVDDKLERNNVMQYMAAHVASRVGPGISAVAK
jgi:hypothetical protein